MDNLVTNAVNISVVKPVITISEVLADIVITLNATKETVNDEVEIGLNMAIDVINKKLSEI